MKTKTPVDINTNKLFNEVDTMSDYILEQYSRDLKSIRKLGDLTLKVLSRLEESLDQIIIMWAEKCGKKISFSGRLKNLMKYSPLLSRMYVSEKAKVLVDYNILKDKDILFKEIHWLNDRRNEFAHYHVYRYKLEKDFKTGSDRRKYLLRLKRVIQLIQNLEKGMEKAMDKTSL